MCVTLLALAQGEHLACAAFPGLWAFALHPFGRCIFSASFLQPYQHDALGRERSLVSVGKCRSAQV